MKLKDPSNKVRKLKLILREDSCVVYDSEVADEIRKLGGVFRVHANPDQHEIKIWFAYPTQGLLRQINTVIKALRCEVASGEVQ